jgi:hypothetical protein
MNNKLFLALFCMAINLENHGMLRKTTTAYMSNSKVYGAIAQILHKKVFGTIGWTIGQEDRGCDESNHYIHVTTVTSNFNATYDNKQDYHPWLTCRNRTKEERGTLKTKGVSPEKYEYCFDYFRYMDQEKISTIVNSVYCSDLYDPNECERIATLLYYGFKKFSYLPQSQKLLTAESYRKHPKTKSDHKE